MNIQNIAPATQLRQRMIEDMRARNLGRHSQRSHLGSCERFAAFLERSPDTATADDIRRFQLFLIESGASICSRNRVMTGLKFLLRVTLRRRDAGGRDPRPAQAVVAGAPDPSRCRCADG
jgi:integrase/recombinase XerD